MTVIAGYSKYFPQGRELPIEQLSAQIKADLDAKVEEIYASVGKIEFSLSSVCMQATRNALRGSVAQISLEEDASLFENGGQCRGISEWFIALYLNMKHKYPDIPTQKLLVMIAREFEDGADIQAAYLQKHQLSQVPILSTLNCLQEDQTKHDFQNKKGSVEIYKIISELEDGVYILSYPGISKEKLINAGIHNPKEVAGHATVVIVENDNYYLVDGNYGLCGTGSEVGSENKLDDTAVLLALCSAYSPDAKAQTIFREGIVELEQLLGEKERGVISTLYSEFWRNNTHVDGMTTMGVIATMRKKGYSISEDQENAIFDRLCYTPGYSKVHFQMSEGIKLTKFNYVSNS